MTFLQLQKIVQFLVFVCVNGMALLLVDHFFLYEWRRFFVWGLLVVGVVGYGLVGKALKVKWLCSAYILWVFVIWETTVFLSIFEQGQIHDDVLIYYVGAFLFLLVGMIVASDVRAVQWLGVAAVVGAGTVSFYGVLQFYYWDIWFSDSVYRKIGRVVATFENPNHFGNYVACCLSLGLVFVFRASLQTVLYLALGLCGLCYTGILLSGSRGAWVSGLLGGIVVVGGIGFHCWRNGKRLPWCRFGGLGVMLVVITLWFANETVMQTPIGSVEVGERLMSIKNVAEVEMKHDVGIHHRYWIWKITWQMISDAPVFGLGYGMYEERFKGARSRLQEIDAFSAALEDASFAHNEYLHIWAEGGLFGLIAFMSVVGVIVWATIKRAWSDRETPLEIWGGLGVVTVMLTHSLVSYPLHLELSSMVFWLTLGILAKSESLSIED